MWSSAFKLPVNGVEAKYALTSPFAFRSGVHSSALDAHFLLAHHGFAKLTSSGWIFHELPYVALAVVAGLAVGVGNYITEDLGFRLCTFMEHHGHMKRLAPDTKRLYMDHPVSNVWTVAAPYILLYYIVSRFMWSQISSTMYFSLAPWDIWPFLWCAMVAHDAWFFGMHMFFHKVKPVYTYVHSQHHQIGSAITALGTAFGDALDIGLCFVAFHLVLGVYLYFQPAWNIAAVVLLIIFEVGTNILGHCGYEAPLWLHATITAGVGLTPLAATSKSHFLHHIDPRYNRSLYFTWWDRLCGTYREDHPLIFEGAR